MPGLERSKHRRCIKSPIVSGTSSRLPQPEKDKTLKNLNININSSIKVSQYKAYKIKVNMLS